MKGAYGWPRIWRELSTRGIHTGKERVRKLMKVHGLRARGKRKFRRRRIVLMAFPSHRTFWNAGLQSRRQTGFGWRHHLCVDQEGWLYLAVVIDLLSRQVVGSR